MRRYHLSVVCLVFICATANAQTLPTSYTTLQHAGTMLPIAEAAPPVHELSPPTGPPVTLSLMKLQEFGSRYHDSPYLIAAQGEAPTPPASGGGSDAAGGNTGQDVASKFTDPTALLTSYQFVTQYNPV